ncbi:chorismate-binding protein [Winogradskyella maritima]|uniref:Chorismate-binding protein n=1 Tax=Winogradskyella maritima TaxID=1517766 RepID=A0ABV8AHD2_9FLAO|nr:chorismate-binding protein [Winogradskyella maritima]
MDSNSFFEKIQEQYKAELPFVVFSRSINNTIKCWLQKDDELRLTDTFSESGYVFSPFDLNQSSVVFPAEHSEQLIIKADFGVPSNLPEDKMALEDSETYMQLIEKAIHSMKTSEMTKVVLSRSEDIERPKTSIFRLYKRLLAKYKNAMVYCWYHPKVGLWMGATPELLFKVEGAQLTTISLAGTRKSDVETSIDWTPKELEEQQIVTDYISEQIASFTSSKSISKTETVKAGHLLHLKTRILARVQSNRAELKPIIEALHPTPAVCGFPRELAQEFILKNENYKREYYTGFLGEMNIKTRSERNRNRRNVENSAYASYGLNSYLYVNLRCMKIDDNHIKIYVGGGITEASEPLAEWEETVNKSQTLKSVIY